MGIWKGRKYNEILSITIKISIVELLIKIGILHVVLNRLYMFFLHVLEYLFLISDKEFECLQRKGFKSFLFGNTVCDIFMHHIYNSNEKHSQIIFEPVAYLEHSFRYKNL